MALFANTKYMTHTHKWAQIATNLLYLIFVMSIEKGDSVLVDPINYVLMLPLEKISIAMPM